MEIKIGGLTFRGDEGPTTFTVARDSLQGWIGKGGVGVRRRSVDRPLAHGSSRVRGYRTGRLVTWSGLIITDSPAQQDKAMLNLASILAEGTFGTLAVASAIGTHTTEVQLDDDPQVNRLVYGETAKYSVSFWAPLPEVYGQGEEFRPGDVENRGNFRAVAIAHVTGPVAAPYTLDVDGRQFIVTQPLIAGQKHVVDTATGRVRRNGVLQTGVVSRAQSLLVPPGHPVTFSGPPNSRLIVRPTFI